MKWGLILAVLALPLVLVIVSDHASATCTNSAQPNANVCKGFSMVGTTTGGVASGRCFSLAVEATASLACTTGGVGSTTSTLAWQMAAGASLTMRYDDVPNGAVPPGVPNKVSIDVRFDNTGTIVRTLLSLAAEPANGATYKFYATSDGTVTGSPRAGTYKVLLTATKDNGPAGVGNYAINSDGAASVGAATSFNKGSLQGQILVSSVARSAYPADSMFAYGTAADESVTLTGTFTLPNGDANVESGRMLMIDAAATTTYQVGSTVDLDSTSLAQAFVADNTFPVTTANYYAGAVQFNGISALTGTFWTTVAATGHGTNIVADAANNVAYDSTGFTIDSRIVFDSDGSGTFATADDMWLNKLTSSGGAVVTKYNRGETAYIEGYLFTARSEQITRSMTVSLEDAGAITCNSGVSLTPTSGKYSTTYTVPTGGACTVANTDAGSPRYLRVVNTDQNHLSVQDNAVSSLHYPDAHLQTSGTLVPDDFPTPDATETLAFFIRGDGSGGDASDSVRLFCKIENVRHEDVDTSGSTVAWNIKNPSGGTVLSGTTDTGSNGWTAVMTNLLATTPLSLAWTATCSDTFNGNSGTDTETFSIGVEGGGGGDTFTGDPLKIFGGDQAYAGETVRLAVSEAFLDGTARTGNAAGTFIRILSPSNSLIVTDATPTEVSHGVYRYDWTAPSTPGPYLVLTRTTDPDSGDPIGTSNIVFVRAIPAAFNGTTDNATLALLLDKLGPQGEPVNIESITLDFWVPVALWLIGLLLFLKMARLLAAASTTVGLGFSLLLPDDSGWQIFALLFLAVALWLEATVRERIYARFFKSPNLDREPT